MQKLNSMKSQKELSKVFKETHGKLIGFFRGRVPTDLKMIVYETSSTPKRNKYGDYKRETDFIRKTHYNGKHLVIELKNFNEQLIIPKHELENYLIFKDIEI